MKMTTLFCFSLVSMLQFYGLKNQFEKWIGKENLPEDLTENFAARKFQSKALQF